MIVYHRTSAAAEIVADGFRDGCGAYLTAGSEHTGVWVSDRPLDANEGATGEALLELDIPTELLEPHEWIEGGKPYREFLVPAALANRFGPPRLLTPDEEERIS